MTNNIRYVRDIQIMEILIVDDQQIFIDEIKSTLRDIWGFSVAGEALDGYQVLEKLIYGLEIEVIFMYKAGVKNTAGLVRWAVENDFIE